MKWTNEQLSAITLPGDLLVSASAGSGKTAVLSERIVRLVSEGTPVSRLLVVTYTRAAAAEMKKRIARELNSASLTDEANAARLRAAANDVGRADISTIHSFLAQVLRRHFDKAELDPAARIADEAAADAMKEEALSAVLEDRYDVDGAFPSLVSAFGGEDKLTALILKLYAYMTAQPEPEEWLSVACRRAALPAEELGRAPEISGYVAAMQQKLRLALSRYEQAMLSPGVTESAQATMRRNLDAVEAALAFSTYTDYANALPLIKTASLKYAGMDDETRAQLTAARDILSKAVKAQKDAFSASLESAAERMRSFEPTIEELRAVVLDFSRRYSEIKARRAYLDYGDLEHISLRLFLDPAVANEYRKRYDYIFVDEYQDANRVQERIFSSIKREDNLFLVGDVKQSIYRFRLAEPALFLDKLSGCPDNGVKRVDLSDNFRSGTAVIDAVNAVFSRVMSRTSGELDYDGAAALKPGLKLAGSAQLHIIAGGDEEGDDLMSDASAQAALAARLISDVMKNEVYTDPRTGASRPYAYGDFAVLSRSPKAVADEWANTLSRAGIPAYADVTGGYFDAVEIQIIMNLLRLIDNRRQDIPLASVLSSPIGGFSAEELIEVRLDCGGELIDALYAASALDTPTGKKARRFIALLDSFHETSRLVSVEELIGRIIDSTGYADFVSALPGGDRRMNLDALIDKARAYENEGQGLHDFLRFMEQVKNTDKLGVIRTAGRNVVQILSIHKSKGLEYPVVILAGLQKNYNFRDLNDDIIPANGALGARVTVGSRRYTTLMYDAIKEKKRSETAAEEMRVLYVGMTRAMHKLIMIASVKDLEKTVSTLALPPSPAVSADAKSALELILNALMDTHNGNALRACFDLGAPRSGGPDVPIFIEEKSRYELSSRRLSEEQYFDFSLAARRGDAAPFPERFKWRYPYSIDTTVPSKVSVSELVGNVISMRRAPDFITALSPAPTDRGTAAHALMEHITLIQHTEASVKEELAALIAAGRLPEEYGSIVDTALIAHFFDSDVGRRLTAAKNAERELEFNIRMPARELFSVNTDEPVLLQGVIDCCFLEPDGYVILDYKTDRLSPGGEPARALHHKRQLDLYSAALAALTGLPVKQRYICFLSTGTSVEV